MRYAVYITRADHWWFECRERAPIAESEWLAYASSDPELREMQSMPGIRCDTGEVLRVPVQNYWEWLAHPSACDSMHPRTFEYNRGGIIVRAPDSELLRKALGVARALEAKVMGDDDEILGDDRIRS
jgi:hypothetical protein